MPRADLPQPQTPVPTEGSVTAQAVFSKRGQIYVGACFVPQNLDHAGMKLEFHHINYVADDVARLHRFYTQVLGLDDIPVDTFPRAQETEKSGYSGMIRFATDGKMQMHLAERNLSVAFKNGEVINPVERGHIAFRTDDIKAFLALLDSHGIPYSDYGTAFATDWHQVFFHDPEGNVIEVHQAV